MCVCWMVQQQGGWCGQTTGSKAGESQGPEELGLILRTVGALRGT